jgi:ADP-ribose pyrophosphatase
MSRESKVRAFSGRFLDVMWERGAEYTTRPRARGVVLVVPVTADGRLVLLEQYRVPLGGRVIEFPAGVVGDEDDAETFEAAARRELLEESGYAARTLEFLLRGPSSPGSSTEVVDFYLARDVTRAHEGGGIGHEEIVVHAVPLAEADAWLRDRAAGGTLVDPRVYLGLHLATRPPH